MRSFAPAVVVLGLFALHGCNCDPAPPDEGEGDGGDGQACVRTDALDEARFCLDDEDCACGSHCNFASCVFDCRQNADCDDGLACDDFGRCNAVGEKVPALRATPRARTFSEPTTVGVSAPNTRHAVRIYPRSAGVGTLQLVTHGDALVWCPGADDPARSCELTGVPEEGVEIGLGLSQLSIVADDGFVSAPTLSVIDSAGLLASIAAVQVDGAAAPATTPTAATMSGLYTGLARLGAGGGLSSPVALEGAETLAAGLRHAVNATVDVDDSLTGVIVIEDPTGFVLPELDDGRLVVAVTAGVVAWPALTWVKLDGTGVEVLTDAVTVNLDPPAGDFALAVPLTITGLQLPSTEASLGTLSFTFTRTAELPANFLSPPTTTSAVALLDADRGADQVKPAVAWESFVAVAFPTDLAASGERLRGVVDRPTSCPDIGARRRSLVQNRCETATSKDFAGGVPFDGMSEAAGTSGCFTASVQLGSTGRGEAVMNCAVEQRLDFGCGSVPSIGGCAVNFLDSFDANGAVDNCAALAGGTCPADVLTPTSTVDNCAALAAATGCTVEDVPVDQRVRTNLVAVADMVNSDILFERVTKRCRLPAVVEAPAACTAAALCADAADLNAEAVFGDAVVGASGLALGSGDVVCGDGSLSNALGAVSVTLDADAEVSNIDVCGDDLADLTTLVSSNAINSPAQLLAGNCFSPGRLAVAFDVAVDPLRSGAPADTAALREAHRLVQTVVELQALLARNALDAYRQQITIEGSSNTGVVLSEIERATQGWGFVLDPRVAGPLLAMPADVLASPDARAELGLAAVVAGTSDLSQAHTQGLSISLLEALSDELETLDFTLERAWFSGSAPDINGIRRRIAELTLTGDVVVALAEALHARALEAGGDLAWEDNYQNARLTYAGLVRRVLDRNDNIDSGVNPLGIEDIDLPLAFGGDVDGDRNRFTAISRFLLGTGVGDAAIVPTAVATAQDALAQARAQWRDEAVSNLQSERRIDEIVRRYGELITGYCGAPIDDPDFNVGTYNVLDLPLDVETCFVEPACRGRPEDFQETLTAAQLGFDICVATRAGVSVGGANDAGLAATLADIKSAFSKSAIGSGPFPLTIVRFEQDVNERIVVANVTGFGEVQIPLTAFGQLGVNVSPTQLDGRSRATTTSGAPAPSAAEVLRQNINDCESTRQVTYQRRPKTNPTSCATADQCVVTDRCTAGACVNANKPDVLDDVKCYFDGAISEQALAVRSAALEVDAARAELDEFVDRYNIARTSCVFLEKGAAEQQALLQAHNSTMNDLNIAKTVAASVAHAAGAAKDCAAAAAGIDSTVPWSAAAGGVAAGTTCVAAGVEAAANIAVEALDNVMEQAERKHEEAVLAAQSKTDQKVCMNDASLELVGAKAQTLRIRQAQQALAAATINLRGQKSYTAGLWADGNAAVAKERALAQSASLGRFVMSDKAERYVTRFQYAQRLTYVAVRAVEYEFQQGLPAQRAAVIAADNPDDLEAVVGSLAGIVNNGTVDGSAPTGLLAVISLREHLLQLTDLTNNIDGEQTLTEIERFRLLLTSPAFGVVDDNGDYIGQRIPFAIAPLRAFGLGDATGVPVGVGTACAERLWSVNAAVVGGDALFNGESSSFTNISIEQKNTFSSQRCDDSVEALQVSTVRPPVNLFADHSTFSNSQSPSSSATDSFASGLMQPYLNVSRADFEREEFEQGSTTQLAGRGLYGDYALFIPAAALSVDDGPGLKLDAVDDILLRLDYVAAAR